MRSSSGVLEVQVHHSLTGFLQMCLLPTEQPKPKGTSIGRHFLVICFCCTLSSSCYVNQSPFSTHNLTLSHLSLLSTLISVTFFATGNKLSSHHPPAPLPHNHHQFARWSTPINLSFTFCKPFSTSRYHVQSDTFYYFIFSYECHLKGQSG